MRVAKCVFKSDMPQALRELLDITVADTHLDPKYGDTVLSVEWVIVDGRDGEKFEAAFCAWCEGNGVEPADIDLIFVS